MKTYRAGRAFCRTRLLALALFVLGWAIAGAARADVHGGIEIGGKGVKATVVDVTGGAEGYDVRIVMAGNQNTTLTAGLGASGRFDADALKNTAAAVARFAEQMQRENKVPAERIYVVGSSGLFSALGNKADAIKANEEALAGAIRDACGLKIRYIDVAREVELSVAGVVPTRYAGTALLFDVGSGNTKGGYRDDDKKLVSAGIPYGSVTFADLAKKRAGRGAYAETADKLRDEVLAPALKEAIDGKPGLLQRPRVYLSGGAVWAMATLIRPGDRNSYVVLTAGDIDAYHKLLVQAEGKFPTPDLSSIEDAAVRQAAQKEIDQVKTVFKPEQLLAGAEILKAAASELDFGKDRKLYFARHARVGWILAYVAEKAGAAR
jgi:exopolyphosphatase/pppGpp-phosphohydrolase